MRIITILVVAVLFILAIAAAADSDAVEVKAQQRRVEVAEAANATAIDVSKSSAKFLEQIKAEATQLVAEASNGERFLILTIGASVRSVFDQSLRDETRPIAANAIDRLQATANNTDLGAAIEEALRSFSDFKGIKRLYLFTDGQNKPRRSSKFSRKSFDVMLSDPGLIPDDVQVVVRLYGSTNLAVNRQNVTVLAESPQSWSAFRDRKPVPPPPGQAEPKSSFKTWLFVGLIALALSLGAGLWLYRTTQAREQRQAREAAENLMMQPVALDDEPRPKARPVEPQFKRCYTISLDDGRGAVILDDQKNEALIGDRWDADIYVADSGGACARLLSEAESETLTIVNCGRTSLFVGRLELKPDAAASFRQGYVQIGIGRRKAEIYSELVVIDTPELQEV